MWRDRNRRIHLSADEARGGRILLTSPLRLWLFIGGLAGAVVLAIVIAVASAG